MNLPSQLRQLCLLLLFIGHMLAKSVNKDIVAILNDEEGQKEHLRSLGYLSREGRSDDDFRTAIEKYQKFFGLTVTGRVDPETANMMSIPRCQVPDIKADGLKIGEFVFSGVSWASKRITWNLNQVTGPFERKHLELVVNNALREWQTPSELTFHRVFINPVIQVDLVTSDSTGEHGDGFPFSERTLAHAFFPDNNPLGGDVHVNMKKDFYTYLYNANDFDLYYVLVHEIGHSLGLEHSQVEDSVMYPSLPPGTTFQGLHYDDIAAIQYAYGSNSLFISHADSHRISILVIFTSLLSTFLR